MTQQIFHALQGGRQVFFGGGTGITAQQVLASQIAHHNDFLGFFRVKRQNRRLICRRCLLVFEQYDGLIGRILRELHMLLALNLVFIGILLAAVRNVFCRVKFTGLHTRRKDTQQGAVDHVFGQDAALDRAERILRIDAAAVHVATGGQTIHGGFLIGDGMIRALRSPFVVVRHIFDGAAVGHHIAAETKGLTQQGIEQPGVGRRRGAVDPVIGAHHLIDAGLLHDVFKGTGVILPQIRLRSVGRTVVAIVFTVIGRVMLQGGNHFEVFVFPIALVAVDKLGSQGAGEEHVLAIGFVITAPAGIAGQVDSGRPIRQAAQALVIIAAGFV